MCERLKVV